MIKNDILTQQIIACAYKVHSELGPGFNERIYHNAFKIALAERKLNYETEKSYKVIYQNKGIGTLKVDLIIEDKVVIEIKAVTGIMPKVFESQLLSYLKVSAHEVGLLINFGNNSCNIRRLIAKSL